MIALALSLSRGMRAMPLGYVAGYSESRGVFEFEANAVVVVVNAERNKWTTSVFEEEIAQAVTYIGMYQAHIPTS